MKLIKNLFYVLAATLTLASCSDDMDYTPAPKETGPAVYFSSDAEEVIEIAVDATSVTIPVYRMDAAAQMTVAIDHTQPAGNLFTVPSSVTFAEGEQKADMTITFDFSKIEPDVQYVITLAISDSDATTQYGAESYTFAICYSAPYKSIGMCTYTDDLLESVFEFSKDGYANTWQVEIEENELTPGLFRLKNPYTTSECPYWDGGIYWNPSVDNYLIIDATNPNEVFLPEQTFGVDFIGEYGMMKVGTSTAGKYDKDAGTITFPVKSFLLALANYKEGAYAFYGNFSGQFKVLMPGFVAVNPAVELEGVGTFVDNDGAASYIVNITPNEDVDGYKYAVVAGNISFSPAAVAEVEAGIIDGTVESVDGKAAGVATVKLPIEADGKYTVVVVPYSANGDANIYGQASVLSFAVAIGGGELEAAPDATLQMQALEFGNAFESMGFFTHNTVMAIAKGENIVAGQYDFWDTASLTKVVAQTGMSYEEILIDDYANGDAYDVDAKDIPDFASANGYLFAFGNTLPESMEFTLIVSVMNEDGKRTTGIVEMATTAAPVTEVYNKNSVSNWNRKHAKLSSIQF